MVRRVEAVLEAHPFDTVESVFDRIVSLRVIQNLQENMDSE